MRDYIVTFKVQADKISTVKAMVQYALQKGYIHNHGEGDSREQPKPLFRVRRTGFYDRGWSK